MENTQEEIIVENPEMVEEVTEATEENKVQVEKGIIIFHTSDNNVQYQLVGENVTLENLTYYRRFLDRIEEDFWNEHTKGAE